MRNHTILFATRNPNKVREILPLLPPGLDMICLADLGWSAEIPEPHETLSENAVAKATYIYERTGIPCFAEDSGLEVAALGGRPGVYSARYAGIHGDEQANIRLLLEDIEGVSDRKACFKAVIAFYHEPHAIRLFEGQVSGRISGEPAGTSGFGYDPIFIPDGFDLTFAQLPPGIKQRISHRTRAMNAFLQFLRENDFGPRSG